MAGNKLFRVLGGLGICFCVCATCACVGATSEPQARDLDAILRVKEFVFLLGSIFCGPGMA